MLRMYFTKIIVNYSSVFRTIEVSHLFSFILIYFYFHFHSVGNVMHEKVRISASFSGDPPDAFPEFSEQPVCCHFIVVSTHIHLSVLLNITV